MREKRPDNQKYAGVPTGRKLFSFLLLAGILLPGLSPLRAQSETGPEVETKTEKKADLPIEERLDILAEELEKLKLNKATKRYESVGGLGPAASGVYHQTEGLSWGGYGEVKYRNYLSPEKTDIVDVHRFILYAGYRFNDWIVLNTEIEYEHAGFARKDVITAVDLSAQTATQSEVNQGEVFVEFAYVDFEFARWASLSLGLNLLPVGITNYMHEPTTFYSVERPLTESLIIPSTWREIGAILHGEFFNGALSYRTGVVNGARAKNFTSASWMRNGRTKGSQARAEDFAFVFNLEHNIVSQTYGNLTWGGSVYGGQADQNELTAVNFDARLSFTGAAPSSTLTAANSSTLAEYYEAVYRKKNVAEVQVGLAEAHFQYEKGPFRTRGLIARGSLNEEGARAINKATGQNVGVHTEGAYFEVAYNIADFFNLSHKLYVFVRNEYVNTQKKTVESHGGDSESILDTICTNVTFCLAGSQMTNGVRDIGVITNTDPNKELYGVNGVPDRVNDQRIFTFGLAYFPHPNVSLKLDYEYHESKSDYSTDIETRNSANNKINRLNFSLGFIF